MTWITTAACQWKLVRHSGYLLVWKGAAARWGADAAAVHYEIGGVRYKLPQNLCNLTAVHPLYRPRGRYATSWAANLLTQMLLKKPSIRREFCRTAQDEIEIRSLIATAQADEMISTVHSWSRDAAATRHRECHDFRIENELKIAIPKVGNQKTNFPILFEIVCFVCGRLIVKGQCNCIF